MNTNLKAEAKRCENCKLSFTAPKAHPSSIWCDNCAGRNIVAFKSEPTRMLDDLLGRKPAKAATKPRAVYGTTPRMPKRIPAKPAKAATAAPASVTDDPTPAQIREWFDAGRAENILSIMASDGISYARAVKRSRRRMIRDGVWN